MPLMSSCPSQPRRAATSGAAACLLFLTTLAAHAPVAAAAGTSPPAPAAAALAATASAAPASASASASGATGASPHPVLDRIRARGYVTLAHREAAIPFSYVDGDGRPLGYALDLCHRVVESLRKSLNLPGLGEKYLAVTPKNRIDVIVDGRADLECGSTTNNAARREKVAFTVPHYVTGARYAVRADSPIGTLEQFEGHTLVSTAGTTPLTAVEQANHERMLRINVVSAPDHDKAIEKVENGQADGFVMDDVLLYGLISQRAHPEKFKVVGKFLTIEPLAIVLSKQDPEFKHLVDTEMKRLITSGEAQGIYEHWFMQPIPPHHVALNLPMNYLLKDFWKYPSDAVPF